MTFSLDKMLICGFSPHKQNADCKKSLQINILSLNFKLVQQKNIDVKECLKNFFLNSHSVDKQSRCFMTDNTTHTLLRGSFTAQTSTAGDFSSVNSIFHVEVDVVLQICEFLCVKAIKKFFFEGTCLLLSSVQTAGAII